MAENKIANFFSKLKSEKFKLIIFSALLVLVVSLVKYKSGEINYLNSDATWHALYTMKCYDETSARTHKFLPIVSMGKESDKWIPWGACIPDKSGNYYYTSFSPAGYAIPYFFIKFFHLEFNEKSLYIFNSLLFAISAIFLLLLLMDFFQNEQNAIAISVCGILIYVLEPELLHGMGIVYWHQSIMQVTLLIQFYAYYIFKKKKSSAAYAVFLLMCLANPYIEWTGYVSNFGFAIFELFSNWKKNTYHALFCAEQVALFTVLSFAFFCFHYLLNVNPMDFFVALKNRFFARNFATSVPIKLLLKGYLQSFKFLWFLFVAMVGSILVIVCTKKIKIHEILNGKYLYGGGY